MQPEGTVGEPMPATTKKSASKSASCGVGGSTRGVTGSQQPKGKQAIKGLLKAHSHPEPPDNSQIVSSHPSLKGKRRTSFSSSESPQAKSHKRRASKGEMQELKLNAMIEDYKRKVFGSHR